MLATARSRLKAWTTAGAGSAAAIGLAWLMGAFGALHKPPAILAPDKAVETGQWVVTPRRAYVAGKRVYGVPLKPGDGALVVEMELENRTAQSSKDYFRLVRPPTSIRTPDPQPFVVLTRDDTMSPELHPGLPERMAFVWTMPGGTPPPKEVALALTTQTYKPRDNLHGTPGWFNERELGTVTLPVGADASTPDVTPSDAKP